MKKIISSIMAILILCSNIAFAAFEEEGIVDLKPGDEYKDGILSEDDFKETEYIDAAGSVSYSDIDDYSVVGILGALDIMGAAEGNLFKPNSYISRGEYIEGLLKLLKIDYSNSNGLDTGKFYDVDKSSKWYNIVYHALSYGLISGYGDNSFRPDNVMSYYEAKVCTVRALGYDEKFGNYEMQASDLGVTDGIHVKNPQAITRMEMARLLYNALEIPTCAIDSFTSKGAVYKKNGDNILYSIWKLYRSSGRVTTSFVETIGTMEPTKNTVVINDKVRYYTEYTADQHFLGYTVNYYYDEEYNLIYMYKDRNSEELFIESDDIISFKDGSLRYIKGDRIKTANLETGYTLLYNGMKPVENYDNNIFDIGDGYIKLISNDSGSTYNIMMIEEYRNYIVKKTLISDNKIELLLENGRIVLSDDTHLTLFDENEVEQEVYRVTESGEETIDLSAIEAGCVVSIFTEYKKFSKNYVTETPSREEVLSSYPTIDTRYMKIIVSKSKISGKIELINSSENEITISGDIYNIAKCKEYSTETTYLSEANLKSGTEVSYLLDYKGKIVDIDDGAKSTEEWIYAYIMRVKKSHWDEAIEEIKVFTTEDKIERYKVKEKIRLNGHSIKNTVLDEKLRESAAYVNRDVGVGVINKKYGQLVKIRLNENEDEIVAMETLIQSEGQHQAYPETQLWRDAKSTKDASTTYKTETDNGGILLHDYEGLFRKPLVVMNVPFEDSDDEKDYQISAIPASATDLVLDFYDTVNMRPEVCISYQSSIADQQIKTGDGPTGNNWTMFNDEMKYVLNEDDEVVLSFSVVQYNGEHEYFTTEQSVIDDLNKLEKGSLLKLFGKGSKVTKIKYAEYNGAPIGPSNLPWEYITSQESINELADGVSAQIYMYEVYDTFSSEYFGLQNGVLISGDKRENQTIGWKRLTAWQQGGMIMYQDEGRDGTVSLGTVDAMKGAKQYGTNGCSIVLAYQVVHGNARQFLIYNLDSNIAN